MNRKLVLGSLLVLTLAGATACSNNSTTAIGRDQRTTANQLDRYQKNQPVQEFDRSQYRQTLLDVNSAEVHGVATTSFFFGNNGGAPLMSCPSQGYPLPSTAQLTNPQQLITRWQSSNLAEGVVPQSEPNGVYTGDSTGTYVVCIASGGVKRIDYWEGYVYTVGGPAHWDGRQVVEDGNATVTTGK